MDIVIIILGIAFLAGAPVGKILAICAIVEGVLIIFTNAVRTYRKNREEEAKAWNELFNKKSNE